MKDEDDSVLEAQLSGLEELPYIPAKFVAECRAIPVEKLDSALRREIIQQTAQPPIRYRMYLDPDTKIEVWTAGENLYYPRQYEAAVQLMIKVDRYTGPP